MAAVGENSAQNAERQLECIKTLKKILGELMRHKHAWPFAAPVDIKGLNILDYPRIIKEPRDFGTIKKNIDLNSYGSDVSTLLRDFYLVFDNTYHYNGAKADVSIMAEVLQKLLIKKLETSNQFTEQEIEIVRATYLTKYSIEPAGAQPGDEIGGGITDENINKSLQTQGAPNLDEILPRFDGDDVQLEMEEKEQLFQNINSLPDKFLEKVVEFIQMVSPHTGLEVGTDVVEFDIEDFDVRVQRHLKRYVETSIIGQLSEQLCLGAIVRPNLVQKRSVWCRNQGFFLQAQDMRKC
ncbi:MAG: hypothetical protein EZS28_009423 [Streblomastix strix]|uniref:Bromo domain-containing protein n=1 Tax=Streblomastix strix TaxID=222440 RepID=A0A5J4WJ76_9EUKA|nr:MAG: hypothetical protein EZS28_009423 [Streblomastix strix]